jgi:hypothetical protein
LIKKTDDIIKRADNMKEFIFSLPAQEGIDLAGLLKTLNLHDLVQLSEYILSLDLKSLDPQYTI